MDSQILFSPIALSELDELISNSVKKALEGYIPKTSPKSDICNLDEAVIITGLPKSALYKFTMKQYRENDPIPLPFFHSGKFLRFRRSELHDWCESRLIRSDNKSNAALTLAKSAGRKR